MGICIAYLFAQDDDKTGTGSCDGLSELSSSQSLSSGPVSEISSGGSASSESRAGKLERVVQQLQFLRMSLPKHIETKSPKSQPHVPVQTETSTGTNFERMKAYLENQKAKRAAGSTKTDSHSVDDGSRQIPSTSEKNKFVLPSSVS